MHAYRRFVQTEMDKRGWTAADLQRSSGLTKQNLSRILRDERAQLQQRPDAATVTALANAFGVRENVVLSYVSEAMGLPTARVEVAAATDLSNEELLRILAERLNEGGRRAPAARAEPTRTAPARDDLADRAITDGTTTDRADIAFPVPRQEDYTRAAMTGTSELDRLDAEAARQGEESQDLDDWDTTGRGA